MFKKLTFISICLLLMLAFSSGAYAQPSFSAAMQTNATANGNGVILTTTGQATAVITVNCASCSGGTQINFEGTGNGTNYSAVLGTIVGTSTSATSTTTSGVTVWSLSVAGLRNVRTRISAYSAGTVTITGVTSVAVASGSTSVTGGNAAASATGSAVPAAGDYIAANVGGTLRGVTATNTSGSVFGLDVNIVGGAAAGGTSSSFGAAVPASGTAIGLSDGTNMQAARVFDADSGAGTQYVIGVNLRASGNGGSTEIGTSGAPIRVDPTGTTSQPVTQPTAANLNATVVGTGTFATQSTLQAGSAQIGHLEANQTVNVALMNGNVTATGNGTSTNGTLRVVIATDQTPLSNAFLVTLTGTNNVTSNSANIATEASLAKLTQTQGSSTSGQSGPLVQCAVLTSPPTYTTAQTDPLSCDTHGGARVTPQYSDGTPITQSDVVPVTLGVTATITNSASRCILVSAASTNATNCKGSAGNLYGFRFVNTTATLYYLRMYNLASAPTCSSATGFIESIPIPAAASGAGIVAMEDFAEAYSTGIGFCFTGGSSSTDNSNAATGVFGTILYK